MKRICIPLAFKPEKAVCEIVGDGNAVVHMHFDFINVKLTWDNIVHAQFAMVWFGRIGLQLR